MSVMKQFAISLFVLAVVGGLAAAGETGPYILPGRIDIRVSDNKDNVHAYTVDMLSGTVGEIPEQSDESVVRPRAGSGEVLESPYGPHALRSGGIGYLDALIDTASGEDRAMPEANVRIKSYVEPFAWSPDGRYLASAVKQATDSVPFDFVVIDLKTREIVLKHHLEPWVEDIVWSPDSRAIAILGTDERWGLLPWEILLALFGHPVPYHSFFLDIFDLEGNLLFNALIRRNVMYGDGAIAWTE